MKSNSMASVRPSHQLGKGIQHFVLTLFWFTQISFWTPRVISNRAEYALSQTQRKPRSKYYRYLINTRTLAQKYKNVWKCFTGTLKRWKQEAKSSLHQLLCCCSQPALGKDLGQEHVYIHSRIHFYIFKNTHF